MQASWGQALIAENWGIRQTKRNAPSRAWLSRLLKDSTGEPMVASQANKAARKYRYYISASLEHQKVNKDQGWRLPAQHLEKVVINGIQNLLTDPVNVLTVLGTTQITADMVNKVTQSMAQLVSAISDASLSDLTTILRPLIVEVRVSLYEVAIALDLEALRMSLEISASTKAPTHTITLPVQLKRRGVEMRIILQGQKDDNRSQDQMLIDLVAGAHGWFEQLKYGTSITEIAKAHNIHLADASRFLPLAFLAPDIVTDILNGDQPAYLTAEKLKRLTLLPLDWQKQGQVLGFNHV